MVGRHARIPSLPPPSPSALPPIAAKALAAVLNASPRRRRPTVARSARPGSGMEGEERVAGGGKEGEDLLPPVDRKERRSKAEVQGERKRADEATARVMGE